MRLSIAVVIGSLVLSACSADGVATSTSDDPDVATTSTPSFMSTTDQDAAATAEDGPWPDGPSALENDSDAAFPDPLVNPEEIISGGPPPDGIPPIDEPTFRSIEEAEDSLEEAEAVIALEIDGDARAYPVEIMIWHEIVNDLVGGVPVSVTYCPLCNSAVTYDRRIEGKETTFGTSGRLYASSLVMYDRATESLWTHFDGRAVVGVLTGTQLDPIPSPLLSWADFKSAYPDGQVLSRDTGFDRNYGQNPYFGYDNPETSPFLFRGDVDDRARAKQRVVGVTVGDVSTAYSLDAISAGAGKATNGTVGDVDVVVFWVAGQATALEGADTADGRDVGSVSVFDRVVRGESLTFTSTNDGFIDEQTGSVWDLSGRAISGDLDGEQLTQIPHLDTFWFAWSTFRPGTELVTEN
jgi:hypothetical protein